MLEALAAFHAENQLCFAPPGHKQGRGADPRAVEVLGEGVFRSDVLAAAGLDDRLSSGQIIQRAQELMADAVGADRTFFSTCGSSLSIKSAMLAVAGPDQQLLVGRDAHKSVVAGLILSGIRPVWVDPCWDAELHLAHPPDADRFAAALAAHPEVKGALVTSPTPYGTCADLEAVARVCHLDGRPLIVDEAWGAHFPFHPGLPRWAMDAGADVCVTSVHKMGSAVEQSSVFHLRGRLVDPVALRSCEDLLGTTSASVLSYATLDAWRRQMVQHGRSLYDRALALADQVRGRIDALPGMHVHGPDDFCGTGRAADLDTLQVVIDIAELGTTGYRAADWLRAEHRINVHLADHRRISAQLSHADDESTTGRLLDALTDLSALDGRLQPPATPAVRVPEPATLRLEQALVPRDAFFGRTEQVPWRRAVGRVCTELLTPYPPGVPVAVPGERFDPQVLEYLETGRLAGMVVPDAADPELRTVRVSLEE